jgi:tricorn protease
MLRQSALQLIVGLAVSALAGTAVARQPIQLASEPSLSPDGRALAFSWRGEIWTVPSEGGIARQLTTNAAADREPVFSPEGSQLAFTSDRSGSRQVYVMSTEGGPPEQLTYHTSGYKLHDWFPDGLSLLVSGSRDHFWKDEERLLRIRRDQRAAEQVCFDDYGTDGCVSPDGKRLLFTREGAQWWRKGYRGSQASQIWMYDLDSRQFSQILTNDYGCLWPMWKPDGKGLYYVCGEGGTFNLFEHELESKQNRQITRFEDDGVVFPHISRDGSTIVFRQLADLYRLRLESEATPRKIEIYEAGDQVAEPIQRRVLSQATAVTFSPDGLEVAFIAGGDLWVMDTELREPRQVTRTPEEEREPLFSPSGSSIWFVSDAGGQSDLWRATRGDAKRFWWQNAEFKLERATQDAEVESRLKWSPVGDRLAFVKGLGDLWTIGRQAQDPQRVLPSWDAPQYDWSPDGKWLVYARQDTDFNQDIWIAPLDGSREPFNLSRHPDNEYEPAWSPDGRVIAFTGRRVESEIDIYFVWLRAEDDEKDSRDRRLEKALEKMVKARRRPAPQSGAAPGGNPAPSGATASASASAASTAVRKPPEVVIDWEDIHERIRRVSIPNSIETSLVWSPDSKKLAFTATVDGKRSMYYIEPAEDLKPKPLGTQVGSHARWIAPGDQIVWLVAGIPSSLTAAGKATEYRFLTPQEVDVQARNKAALDLCWRIMRDRWYDERLGNKNWDQIRRKYLDMAAAAVDETALATVIHLMLGELNGSHLGFSMRPSQPASSTWKIETPHLGLRFDPAYKGPGLQVRDVIPGGPASEKSNRIEPGEIVLAIDGRTIDPALDLCEVLNGPLARDIRLTIRNAKGEDREVMLRPIAYSAARELLYEKWLRDNRAAVDKASGGKLGYLHVRGMNATSFHRFEAELYSVGFGKEGLVIDVRENGGGSTTDHLLTALTQPMHAITVPRGGGPGYPQDRKVYATWNKPIVVLCNQSSFSNAEIFSHAIKTLGRGPLVGVPTAGGVVSTGAAPIMDLGVLRLPTRGWYVLGSGEDMELHGAVPDHIVWPQPGELPAGKDVQLEKAVEVLLADVEKWSQRPQPKLRKATER